AEFSRDVDLAVLAENSNLARLRAAMEELQAELVLFPPLDFEELRKGHACQFRVGSAAAPGLRIDIMSAMQGCDPFEDLWRRRRRMALPGVGTVNLLAMPDLVQANKTQRDKDWPMIRRLVEADYHNRSSRPAVGQIRFWLKEARTPEILRELCLRYPKSAAAVAADRPVLRVALNGNLGAVHNALRKEEEILRAKDRAFWQPLKDELFLWRQARRRG